MAKLIIQRTNIALPDNLETVSQFLFHCFKGVSETNRKSWYKFWGSMMDLEPGEVVDFQVWFSRSGPFHRFHMAMEQALYTSQDKFSSFDIFRCWLKIGSGWVDMIPGRDGQLVPVPRSVSWAQADEEAFRQYHEQVLEFLRSDHAPSFLWPHLSLVMAHDMMDKTIREFSE